jgi:hypothetical protein
VDVTLERLFPPLQRSHHFNGVVIIAPPVRPLFNKRGEGCVREIRTSWSPFRYAETIESGCEQDFRNFPSTNSLGEGQAFGNFSFLLLSK